MLTSPVVFRGYHNLSLEICFVLFFFVKGLKQMEDIGTSQDPPFETVPLWVPF